MKIKDLVLKEEIDNLDEDECSCCYTYEKINERTRDLRHRMDTEGYICTNCSSTLSNSCK